MVYEEHIILEAIDQLRLRKARPDFQRISNFLMRNFSVSPSEVKIALEKCIERDIVIKVEYKGNISYRNATRSRKSKYENIPFNGTHDSGESPSALIRGPSKKFKALLVNAFTELIVQEPDYLYDGVPGKELILKILSKDTVRTYTKKYLSILIDKLAANGVLHKVVENGNYLLGPNLKGGISEAKVIEDHKVVKINVKTKSVNKLVKKGKMDVGANSNSNKNNIRVGSRRKRAKKVFDPSDNNIPKKRGRPRLNKPSNNFPKPKECTSENESKPETIITSREQGGVCSVCHNKYNSKKYANDHLVSCRECSNKAHYSCLNGDDMMLKMYPDNTWQCPHCKTCCSCFETSDAGILMVCSLCADAYHAGCHEPPLTDKFKNGNKWFCINCQKSEQLIPLQFAEIHPNLKKEESFDIKQEISEELDIKEEYPPIIPLCSSSSSDEDSKDSLRSSQTPPTLSPQEIRSPAASPEQNVNYNYLLNNSIDAETHDQIDPSIPDASHWTCDDVYNYFVQYFPEEAKVFKEEEIDGRSLLLMKRLDVLTGLNLKLGPALNIYRHVVKLQFRRDDPRLYWV